jgi:hypothetical protein
VDLSAYREEAEAFVSALDREYYLHFSGQKDELEIEPIYERHAGLVTRDAVDRLRESGNRELLDFAAKGLIGQETKHLDAELARREAALEIEVDGERISLRQAPVVQANEPDRERRQRIDAAQRAVLERELQPLYRESFARTSELVRELGWRSVRAMTEDLSGIDLAALAQQTEAFLRDTEPSYEPLVEPRLREELGYGFDRFQRADIGAFFRAPAFDAAFPAERLLERYRHTMSGMSVDGEGVVLDVDERPKKAPRAFCSPARVPDEVYLVIAPHGGREDYETLFHEAGHAQHYSHVDAALPFEDRYLGDNSVTESFAFLFQSLSADPSWLGDALGVANADDVVAQARAAKLVLVRRYCAKLSYELELQDAPGDLDTMPALYSRRLSEAVHVDWPRETWLSDVDPFFYSARYLRAWALETHLRRHFRERFGDAWWASPEAGEQLRALWRHGQRLNGDELLAELTGAQLDFSAMLAEFAEQQQ